MSTEPKHEAADEPEDDFLPDEKLEGEGLALARAMDATDVKTDNWSFAEVVRQFKAVEAEFVARAGDDESFALVTKQRVAERLLEKANYSSEPFETCQLLWNDLLRLGFDSIEKKSTMTWFYADCCRQTKQPEAGLAVLEPLITDLEQLLAEPTVTKAAANYYQDELATLAKLRARLKAQQGKP